MKLTFEEKKLLYTYGCADLELTRKRLCGVAGQTGTTRCSTSSVPRWSIIP